MRDLNPSCQSIEIFPRISNSPGGLMAAGLFFVWDVVCIMPVEAFSAWKAAGHRLRIDEIAVLFTLFVRLGSTGLH